MNRIRLRWGSFLLAGALLFPELTLAASVRIPYGFRQIAREPGVLLLQRRRDFVQVVTPAHGGSVALLHGTFSESGLFGSFARTNVDDWWKEWHVAEPNAFALVNGQFFDTRDPDTAPLAFSIKANGHVYEGYGDASEYPGKKKMLVLGSRYTVESYNDDPVSLLHRSEDNILVGLDPAITKNANSPVPRTFIGVTRTGDAVIFSSSSATQASAFRAMRSLGVSPNQIVMFDGGYSSHLVYEGKVLVPKGLGVKPAVSREKLPQMIGTVAGERL